MTKCKTCGTVLTIETTYIDDQSDTLRCAKCNSIVPEGTKLEENNEKA